MYNATQLALTSPLYIRPTFANSGNLQGIVLGFMSSTSTSTTPYGVNIRLEQWAIVTMNIASPCVVTWTSHGLADGTEVSFTTGGSLPTGITAGNIYYVRNSATNTFNISTTPSGALVNTSGSQSGTHACGATRTQENVASEYINPEFNPAGTLGTTSGICTGVGAITPVKFSTPYAIDTTVGKWRFRVANDTTVGTTSIWQLATSDGTNPGYIAWCDNKVTASSGNDILIIVDKINIDTSFTTSGAFGSGETDCYCAGWICRSDDISETGIAKLECTSPASSYTFTLGGVFYMASYSGMRIGTSLNPISLAKKFTLTRVASVSGSVAPGAIYIAGGTSSGRSRGRTAFFAYGEVPTKMYATLASNANTGQANLVTTEDMSTYWSNGDSVFIGKSDSQGQGVLTWHDIQSISGTTITLTSNIATNVRKAGGIVVRRSVYGVVFLGATSAAVLNMRIEHPLYFEVQGTYSVDTTFGLYYSSSNAAYPALLANTKQYIIEDNLFVRTANVSSYDIANIQIPRKGISCKRNITVRDGLIMYAIYALYSKAVPQIPFTSGTLEFKNNIALSVYQGGYSIAGTTNIKQQFEDNIVQNCNQVPLMALTGINSTFKNNTFWGVASTAANNGAIRLLTSINMYSYNNKFDKCLNCYTVADATFIMNAVFDRELFGVEEANTYILYTQTNSYFDITFKSPNAAISIEPTSVLTGAIEDSALRITNEGLVTNKDIVYKPYGIFTRCGSGLPDTTVRTSGTDKFSIRFEPQFYGSPLVWKFNIPTGDIQTKTISNTIWCKINNSNYWAASFQLPRLTAVYDNETATAYAQAAQDTSWQQLQLPITPTTAAGEMELQVSCDTDATTTDAYVYFDDLTIFYPPDSQINLGGLDIWSNAMPITPPITTSLSPMDVWSVLTSTQTTSGTMGKTVVDIDKKTGLIPALL